MAEVKYGDTVKVHFSVKLEDGTIFDDTFNLEPMTFTIGNNQLIPGVEDAIVGMSSGEFKTVKIPAEKAFGPHKEELVEDVDKNMFPPDLKLEAGQHLQIPQKDGQPYIATVLKVTESTVTLDKNHPLAGKDLIVDIKLEEILK